MHSKKQERKADILGINFIVLKATSSRNINKKSILFRRTVNKTITNNPDNNA